MRQAGFFRDESADGPVVGIWSTLREIGGIRAVVKVDLLVPDALGGAGRRAARIVGHERGSMLKVRGLEGCLVDREVHSLSALEPDDSRSFEIMVAGPASLLVAKTVKLQERTEEAEGHRRDRRRDKDTLDVLRLLRAIDSDELAAGLRRLASNELSADVTSQAVAALPALFGGPDSLASQMAARAATPMESSDEIAAACAALVGDLLDAVRIVETDE
jgi:hypothetical protein